RAPLDLPSLPTRRSSDLEQSAFDLVVLDVMMPGEDGLTLCRQVRSTSDLPIILLTAMTDETDRIVGLELGADDYVSRPFNPRELLARIKTVLRRDNSPPPAGHRPAAPAQPRSPRDHAAGPLDRRLRPSRAPRRRWRGGAAEHGRVPPALRLPRSSRRDSYARAAARSDRRPRRRQLRPQHRQ